MSVREIAKRVMSEVRANPEYRLLVNRPHEAQQSDFDGLVRQTIDGLGLDATVATQVAATINPRLAR